MNPGKLRHKIEVWKNVASENELLEESIEEALVKKISSQIIPMTGMIKNEQGDTKISGTTHKIRTRYSAGKFIKPDMWFKYKNSKYEIKYILNPFESNRTLEFFCEVIFNYE
ncbi:head-tail adaptor protein [Helicovermis profundi]|uniref:Head-tail adaptor protein n=1 Tax=Helicovermis profundi TaxID=3065157 RepID=A0AAU9E2W1_9FIRM|nr:hypothetical protein HLPR_11420 [Clostridia bacterium S502]